MTRRGTFGHQPRSTPNLTSTIVALAQQMLAQEDSNIMNAWQSGGLYEGKPVTDAMVLAHWKDRASGLSKDDPSYDEYNNQYIQLQYNIAQSKAATEYAQSAGGAADDAKMANFYLSWAKKIPKDSDQYRTLQQDAAKFLTSSSSKARADAATSKTNAYNAFVADTTQRYIGLGGVLTDLMTQVAQENNLIGQNQDLSNFTLKGANDPGRMEDLLATINSDMKANPSRYTAVVNAIRQYDPNWDGNLTSTYFANALRSQVQGYSLIQSRATTDGYTSKATAAGKSLTATNTLGAEVQSWPVASAYSIARAQFDQVWNSPAATDEDKRVAAGSFATAIDGFANTSGLDTAMSNRLLKDAAALRGDPSAGDEPSFNESYLGIASPNLGTTNASGSTTGEDAAFAKAIQQIDFWKQQYDNNPGYYVYAPSKVDAQGNPTYDPTGNGPVGVVPRASVAVAPGQNAIVPIPLITGGSIMEVVSVKPITFDSPFDGKSTVVGQYITYNQGGVVQTMYGVPRPDGTTDWTPVSPFAAGVSMAVKPDGLHLTVQPVSNPASNAATAASLDAQMAKAGGASNIAAAFANGATPVDGAHWVVKGTAANGQRTDYTVTWKGGQFTEAITQQTLGGANGTTVVSSAEAPAVPVNPAYDPTSATGLISTIWDQARLTAGPNPQIDFSSLVMATLVTSGAIGASVSGLWSNPVFQSELQSSEAAQAGGDPVKQQALADADAGIASNLIDFGPAVRINNAVVAAGAKKINLMSAPVNHTIQPPSISMGHPITVPTYTAPTAPAVTTPSLLDTATAFLKGRGLPGQAIRPTVTTPTPVPAAPTPTPITPPVAPITPISMPQAAAPVMPTPISMPQVVAPTMPTPVPARAKL